MKALEVLWGAEAGLALGGKLEGRTEAPAWNWMVFSSRRFGTWCQMDVASVDIRCLCFELHVWEGMRSPSSAWFPSSLFLQHMRGGFG